MKAIQHIKLELKKGKIQKVCMVELCQIEDDNYIVNYRMGRKGKGLKEGTATKFPTTLKKATIIFNQFIERKKQQGYISLSTPIFDNQAKSTIMTNEIQGMEAQKTAILKHLKRAVDFPSRTPSSKEWSLSRVIWRAGELKMAAATDYLVGLHTHRKSDPVFHYSNAWALGRCGIGHKDTIETLEYYAYKYEDEAVQRIALEGLRATTTGKRHKAFLDYIFKRLPTAFQSQLEEGYFDIFEKTVEEYLYNSQKTDYKFLERLYLLDKRYPVIRKVLVNFAGLSSAERHSNPIGNPCLTSQANHQSRALYPKP